MPHPAAAGPHWFAGAREESSRELGEGPSPHGLAVMPVHRCSLCRSSSSIVFTLLSFLVAPPAAAQLPWTHCGDGGAFEQNST